MLAEEMDKLTPAQQYTAYELMDDLECSEEITVLAINELGDSKIFGIHGVFISIRNS